MKKQMAINETMSPQWHLPKDFKWPWRHLIKEVNGRIYTIEQVLVFAAM
jgi:hypothetical protein